MRHAIHVRRSKSVHEVSHSERHPFFHGAAEMLVSFLRRRLGSVLLVLHRRRSLLCHRNCSSDRDGEKVEALIA